MEGGASWDGFAGSGLGTSLGGDPFYGDNSGAAAQDSDPMLQDSTLLAELVMFGKHGTGSSIAPSFMNTTASRVEYDEKKLREAAAAEVAALTKKEQRGVKRKLTPEERAQQNRDRNREHARNTRLRKKAYMNKLKDLVSQLRGEKEKEDEERKVWKERFQKQAEVRQSVVSSFLNMRLKGGETVVERWRALLEDDCTVTLPITPYRSFNPVEIVSCSRVLVGVEAIMRDAASVAAMMETLGMGLPGWAMAKRSGKQLESSFQIESGEVLQASDTLMCTWMFRTGNAQQCGLASGFFQQGMLHCNFSAENKLRTVEIMFDVMGFMQQLQRPLGRGEGIQPVPNTLSMALYRADALHSGGALALPQLICQATADFRVVHVNAVWAEHFGPPQEQAEGHPLFDILGERAVEVPQRPAEGRARPGEARPAPEEPEGRADAEESEGEEGERGPKPAEDDPKEPKAPPPATIPPKAADAPAAPPPPGAAEPPAPQEGPPRRDEGEQEREDGEPFRELRRAMQGARAATIFIRKRPRPGAAPPPPPEEESADSPPPEEAAPDGAAEAPSGASDASDASGSGAEGGTEAGGAAEGAEGDGPGGKGAPSGDEATHFLVVYPLISEGTNEVTHFFLEVCDLWNTLPPPPPQPLAAGGQEGWSSASGGSADGAPAKDAKGEPLPWAIEKGAVRRAAKASGGAALGTQGGGQSAEKVDASNDTEQIITMDVSSAQLPSSAALIQPPLPQGRTPALQERPSIVINNTKQLPFSELPSSLGISLDDKVPQPELSEDSIGAMELARRSNVSLASDALVGVPDPLANIDNVNVT